MACKLKEARFREKILPLYEKGMDDAEVAESLGVYFETVKRYRRLYVDLIPDAVRESSRVGRRISALTQAHKARKNTAFQRENENANRSSIQFTMQADTEDQARIVSLDDMLRAFNVDTEVWKVEKWVVNKWEVGIGRGEADITWEDGKITKGHMARSGKANVSPLFQIKVWLIRKRPIQIEYPFVTPFRTHIRKLQEPKLSRDGGIRTAFVWADSQIGFWRDDRTGGLTPLHDRKALDIGRQIIQELHPDVLINLGDDNDMTMLSKYEKTVHMVGTLRPAILEQGYWLEEYALAAGEGATKKYIEGNHDSRLPERINEYMMDISEVRRRDSNIEDPPIVSLDYWLDLGNLGYEFIGNYPNGEYWLNENIVVIHGDVALKNEGQVARNLLDRYRACVVFGHIHKQVLFPKTMVRQHGNVTYYAFSPGCTCRLDGIVPAIRGRMGWQQGFGIIHFEPGNGFMHFEPVQIYNGKAVWRNVVVSGEDRRGKIAEILDYPSLGHDDVWC